jgi:hypothetical protein
MDLWSDGFSSVLFQIETTQQLELLRLSDDGRKGMNKKKKKQIQRFELLIINKGLLT